MFGSAKDVPTSDEEAMIALKRLSKSVTDALQGIFSAYRVGGLSVLEAYEKALLAHVVAGEAARARSP